MDSKPTREQLIDFVVHYRSDYKYHKQSIGRIVDEYLNTHRNQPDFTNTYDITNMPIHLGDTLAFNGLNTHYTVILMNNGHYGTVSNELGLAPNTLQVNNRFRIIHEII